MFIFGMLIPGGGVSAIVAVTLGIVVGVLFIALRAVIYDSRG